MRQAREIVDVWSDRGFLMDTPQGSVFVMDTPATDTERHPPLVVLHGFPTSSFDFRHVLDDLSRHRRVILFDQIGFGLSEKPDRRYGIHLHADTASFVIEGLAIGRMDLLTHDMGDSVGGELLARNMEGNLDVDFRRRVVTNGSIYLRMAHLTAGQQLLSSLPDGLTDPIPAENFSAGVAATFAPENQPSEVELEAIGILGERNDGLRLLARLIRYLEDRRAEETRYTGAIENHPSPLGIVWGELDPVADVAMADRLNVARADSTLHILDNVGHYPMVESPGAFCEAVLSVLESDDPVPR